MRFDQPQLLVDVARDAHEQVFRIGVADLAGLRDRLANPLAERRQGGAHRLHMVAARENLRQIFGEGRGGSGHRRGAPRGAAERRDALRHVVDMELDRIVDGVEQRVQGDERGALHVPMGLLHLARKIGGGLPGGAGLSMIRLRDMHDHGHDGTGHGSNARRIFWALLLIGGFMIVEVIGGVISGSLALLADAAHMLVDTVALLFAWIAFRLSRRPADDARSYGYHRFPVLAAFANGISLIFIVGWIFVEAAGRLADPTAVLAGPMLVVAGIGLVVNIAAFAVLHGADRSNLNVRGALVHVLGDLLGSAAAVGAAVVILTTGWMPIDPLLSVLVGLLVLRSAWFLVRDAAHVLLEGTPARLDVREIGPDLVSHLAAVEDVHHVHAWSLSQERSLLTLHARIADGANPDTAIAAIQGRLKERFDIRHVTVQVELEGCTDEPVAAPG